MIADPSTGSAPIRPEWPAPVGALASTRAGGVSTGPWRSLNLGLGAGDDPAAVAENRRRWQAMTGAAPVWLQQVHGTRVVRIGLDDVGAEPQRADASWTDAPGVACTVLVADCLPVLLARADGRAVAAAHAGWRGLAAGVLESTVSALCEGSGCAPSDLLAWLGPCIGPARFEVGADVLAAFGAGDPDGAPAVHFRPHRRADGSPGWMADLHGLARDRLAGTGVTAVHGLDACTASDPSRFFSYRRDGVTGRLAAAVWRRA